MYISFFFVRDASKYGQKTTFFTLFCFLGQKSNPVIRVPMWAFYDEGASTGSGPQRSQASVSRIASFNAEQKKKRKRERANKRQWRSSGDSEQ